MGLMLENLHDKLSPKEREIFHALETQEREGLAEMYLGAKICWLDENQPERMAITAHCLRELCEKLRWNKNHQSLGDVVKQIVSDYSKIKEPLIMAHTQKQHDDNMGTAIQMLESLSSYAEENLKSKANQIEDFVKNHRKIDLPINNRISSDWKKSEDYFIRVAHHSQRSNPK